MTEETANHQQWDSNRCTIKPERKAIVKLYRPRQHGVCIAINEGKRWRASGNADFHGTASRPVELDRKVWNWISRKHLRCDRILTGMQAGNESGKGFFLSRQNRYTRPWEIVNELPTFYRSNFFLHIFFSRCSFLSRSISFSLLHATRSVYFRVIEEYRISIPVVWHSTL